MPPLRVISLLPSGTEILHALGFGNSQVGRSHECDFPTSVQSLPICSRPGFHTSGSSLEIDTAVKSRLADAASLFQLDVNTIRSLAPTHIVTQSQCAVCAVSLEDVEQALQLETGTGAQLISLEPNSLRDIWGDIVRIADACGRKEAGTELIQSLTGHMGAITERASAALRRPSIACIEWLEPLMSAGNWIPELIDASGGRNLFGEAGKHSPWMTWEELLQADPEVIVALPCGFDLRRTRDEMHWLTARPGWQDLKAVRGEQVYLCDGNQFMNRPGPRVVESLRIFAEILHPELFPPTLAHSGWERF